MVADFADSRERERNDTAKHRYILRPAKATLERIRRIDDAVAVAGVGQRAAALEPGAHVAATGRFGREN
jgi:hypothetical protein